MLIVFGRYGGYEQFDIQYVHRIVYNVARENPNIYFLFANTKRFCPFLTNIIHIDKIVDNDKKVEFINSCDAMIWARSDGETFGLSIAEFSIKNKPVLDTKVGDLAHVELLGEKGIWYEESNLRNILLTFDKESVCVKMTGMPIKTIHLKK
jgi:glycosyltransferase involved in cell wall biosynthesis